MCKTVSDGWLVTLASLRKVCVVTMFGFFKAWLFCIKYCHHLNCCCLFPLFSFLFFTQNVFHIVVLCFILRLCESLDLVLRIDMWSIIEWGPLFFEGLVVLVKGHLFSFHCPSPLCKYAQQTDRAYVEVKPTNTQCYKKNQQEIDNTVTDKESSNCLK